MSCFVVRDEVITSFVTYLHQSVTDRFHNGNYAARTFERDTNYILLNEEHCKRLARDMHALNVEAYNQRYGSSEELPSLKFEFVVTSDLLAFKNLGCLLYQCAEGNVPDTDLYKALRKLEGVLAKAIVIQMPEYEALPWGG
jgi:hypothetical protein